MWIKVKYSLLPVESTNVQQEELPQARGLNAVAMLKRFSCQFPCLSRALSYFRCLLYVDKSQILTVESTDVLQVYRAQDQVVAVLKKILLSVLLPASCTFIPHISFIFCVQFVAARDQVRHLCSFQASVTANMFKVYHFQSHATVYQLVFFHAQFM